MAGDWIKIRSNLHEDPRVVQMSLELSADELHVVGMLWRAWSWADAQSLDGNALSVTEMFLDRIVRRDGFAVALRKVGWLEGRNGALTFPRFAEHNGQTAKSRAVTQKRVASHRNANRVTDVTLPPLPEKRREEKKVPILPVPSAPPTPTDSMSEASLPSAPPPLETAQPAKPPPAKEEAIADPRHHVITSRWGGLYRDSFGNDYVFNGRDATTLKRFLSNCKETADAILQTAVRAWIRTREDRFAKSCKMAATLHGLCTAYNEIQVELQMPAELTTKGRAGFA